MRPHDAKTLAMRCCDAGHSGPELSSGQFLQQLLEHLTSGATRLSITLQGRLHAEQRLEILREYEAGKSHLRFYFAVKLHYFQQPPWCVFALCSTNPAVCQAADDKIAQSDCQHPLLLSLQKEPIRSQLGLWRRNGYTFAGVEAPELKVYLAKLAFCPCNTRYVEGEHARIKRLTQKAPRHSDAYISLKRRLPEMTAALAKDPSLLQVLAEKMQLACNGKKAVHSLGLAGHITLSALPDLIRVPERVYISVIYRADAHSKFIMQPPAITLQPSQPQSLLVGPPAMDAATMFEHKLMVRHMCTVLLEMKDKMLSVPLSNHAFYSLEHIMAGANSADHWQIDRDLQDEVSAHILHALPATKDHVFCIPSRQQVSRIHVPRQSKRTKHTDIHTVTCHRALDINPEGKEVLLQVEPIAAQASAHDFQTAISFNPRELDMRFLGTISGTQRTHTVDIENSVPKPDPPPPKHADRGAHGLVVLFGLQCAVFSRCLRQACTWDIKKSGDDVRLAKQLSDPELHQNVYIAALLKRVLAADGLLMTSEDAEDVALLNRLAALNILGGPPWVLTEHGQAQVLHGVWVHNPQKVWQARPNLSVTSRFHKQNASSAFSFSVCVTLGVTFSGFWVWFSSKAKMIAIC